MAQKAIGIGEWLFSDEAGDVLVTYALGSCVALVVYSPLQHFGAMAHIALPSSQIDVERARVHPAYFADTAIPLMLGEFAKRGVPLRSMVIKLVGGAQMFDSQGVFDIGRRNVLEIKKHLWQNMLSPVVEDVGGNVSRTVSFFLEDGKVVISSQNKKYEI